jgi:hypothetical protein
MTRTERSAHLRRRAVVTLAVVFILASVGVLFTHAWAWGFTADGHRRAQESVAHESYLHQQLSNRDAILELQRRIYIYIYIWSASGGWRRSSGNASGISPPCARSWSRGQSQRAIADQGHRVDVMPSPERSRSTTPE